MLISLTNTTFLSNDWRHTTEDEQRELNVGYLKVTLPDIMEDNIYTRPVQHIMKHFWIDAGR